MTPRGLDDVPRRTLGSLHVQPLWNFKNVRRKSGSLSSWRRHGPIADRDAVVQINVTLDKIKKKLRSDLSKLNRSAYGQ